MVSRHDERGFIGEKSIYLLRGMSHVVMGRAASYKHEQALAAPDVSRPVAAKREVMVHASAEATFLRGYLPPFAREVIHENREYGLYLLLRRAVVADPR